MLPVLRRSSGWTPAAFGGPADRLETFFNRMFEDVERAFEAPVAWAGMLLAMWSDEDHLYIEAEVPGAKLEDVEATVHEGQLYLKVVRKPEEGRRYIHNSRAYGQVERVITLPEPVDADKVQATLSDGILRLTLPKTPEAKPRRINIQGQNAPHSGPERAAGELSG